MENLDILPLDTERTPSISESIENMERELRRTREELEETRLNLQTTTQQLHETQTSLRDEIKNTMQSLLDHLQKIIVTYRGINIDYHVKTDWREIVGKIEGLIKNYPFLLDQFYTSANYTLVGYAIIIQSDYFLRMALQLDADPDIAGREITTQQLIEIVRNFYTIEPALPKRYLNYLEDTLSEARKKRSSTTDSDF